MCTNNECRNLGSRVCGIEGQQGSNNGGETRGAYLQHEHAAVVRFVKEEEKKNPTHALYAAALDLTMTTPVSQ